VIAVLLMLMKSQVLMVIFRTPGRVDVEPLSVAECASARRRAPERGKSQLSLLKTK
jgi:hypothetical protein